MKLWIMIGSYDGDFVGAFTSEATAAAALNIRRDCTVDEVESDPVFTPDVPEAEPLSGKWRVTLADSGEVLSVINVPAEEIPEPWIRTDGALAVTVLAEDESTAVTKTLGILERVKTAELLKGLVTGNEQRQP